MKLNRYWKLVAIGITAYLIFLLATVPVRLVFDALDKKGIHVASVTGTLWRGQALGLRTDLLTLGDVSWALNLRSLFTGKLAAHIDIQRAEATATGVVALGFNGQITLRDFNAHIPIESLLSNISLPGGWLGTVQAKINLLTLEKNWPTAMNGTIDIIDLTGPAQQPARLGTFRIQFPAKVKPDDNTQGKTALVGDLTDIDGAIALTGTIKLSADRSYFLDTKVAARENAPAAIKNGINILGPADAAGLRPFSVEGTL